MSTPPAFKRLPRAIREEQMLDAAVKVFSHRGFHAASMDEIADDAGISKPMVYAYLGSKEQLFIACLHREGTRMMEAIAGAVGPDLPPDEQLWRGLRAFFGFVGAHRDGWAMLYRQARGEQPFAGALAEMRARMVQVVAGMLDRSLRDHRGPGAGQGRRDGAARRDGAGQRDDRASRDTRASRDDPERIAQRRAARETELEVMSYALVGAAESLADWLADHPDAEPDRMADRMIGVAWLGADRLLDGEVWRSRRADR